MNVPEEFFEKQFFKAAFQKRLVGWHNSHSNLLKKCESERSGEKKIWLFDWPCQMPFHSLFLSHIVWSSLYVWWLLSIFSIAFVIVGVHSLRYTQVIQLLDVRKYQSHISFLRMLNVYFVVYSGNSVRIVTTLMTFYNTVIKISFITKTCVNGKMWLIRCSSTH